MALLFPLIVASLDQVVPPSKETSTWTKSLPSKPLFVLPIDNAASLKLIFLFKSLGKLVTLAKVIVPDPLFNQ